MATLNRRFVRSFRRTTPSAPILALINAALVGFADLLFSPYLLATLIALLGGNTWKTALPLAISGLAWSLSVPVRGFLARISPPGRYLATTTGIIRTAAAAFLAWTLYRADDLDPHRQIDTLVSCFTAYVVASAINLPTTRGLLAASTPTIRAASLFRTQRVIGGLAAVAAGAVAVLSLRTESVALPKDIGVLYVLAAVAVAAATWFQFMTTLAATRATVPLSAASGRIWSGLGNPAVRRLLGFRFLAGLATLADPFLIIYGLGELGFARFYIAAALLAYAGFQFLGATVVPAWTAHSGPRAVLLIASLARMLAVVGVLSIPAFAETSLYTDRFDNAWPATLAFVGAFGLLGASSYLQGAGSQRYLTDVVPIAFRSATISLANLVLAIASLAPLLGAYLIDQYDTETVLIVATVLAFVGFATSGMLFDPAPRTVRRAGTWRQRRTVRRAA